MTPWQARCIQGYVAAHLHGMIKVTDLARSASYELIQLNRAFKESFGCTPHQYVMRQRIERAQNIMLLSDDPLDQIAAECGFGSRSHFSRLFRRTVGQRPSAWRRLQASLRADALHENHEPAPEIINRGAYREYSDGRLRGKPCGAPKG